ncbi:MAG: PriCT-2 domain-containing protein [Saprospiraceae bacterium]
MESVLNVNVSCFANYTSADNPRPVNLLRWLTSDKYRAEVEAIRQTSDKADRDRLKAKLPAITPSGLFTRREAGCLVQHSGLLQFDIDFKENQHIANFPDLKKQLCNIKNVAYCGLSVSGAGYWGLIPISEPQRHKEHFEALRQYFADLGVMLDDKPKNVASLRGYSYDPEGYFNHSATPYRQYIQAEPERYERRSAPQPRPQSTEAEKVEAILSQINAGRIDITGSYGDWFAIGCALANTFGEAGRDYFHQLSQYHSEYSYKNTDRQFDHCKRGKGGKSIATLYEIAERYGVLYRNGLSAAPAPPQRHQAAKRNALPPGHTVKQFTSVLTGVSFDLELDAHGIPAMWR